MLVVYSFAICSPGWAMLAKKIKLLAHDNKLRACCLLNLPCRFQPAGVRLVQFVLRHFQRLKNWYALAARAAPKSTREFCRIQGSIVSRISDKMLSKLRIARAYVKLLCIPQGSSETSVSLACIGNCEIRIFEGPQVTWDGMPLFWLELFDHSARMSVDSFSCREIEDAVVVFEDFISQAGHLKEASGPDDAGTQD
jgi:hypothetical protein